MSVSSIGSTTSTSTSAEALQQQLKADQKTLAEDQAKQAAQATINSDQAKVTTDQQAITRAQNTKSGSAQGANAHGTSAKHAKASPPSADGSADSTTTRRADRDGWEGLSTRPLG